MMKTINTKTDNPILSIEGNKVLCSRGDLAIGYKILYPEKYSQSQGNLDSIHSDWVRSLNLFPTGTIVLKTDIFIKERFDSSCLGDKTFLQRSDRDYFDGRKYLSHHAYIFFIDPGIDTMKNNTIRNPFIFPSVKNIKNDESRQAEFENQVEESTDLISKGGYLSFTPLSEEEIKDYFVFYFNGFQSDFLTDAEIKKDRIEANGNLIGIFAITNEEYFPDRVETAVEDSKFSSKEDKFIFYQGFMDDISLELKQNHIYNQVIFLDNHKAHEEQIDKNRNVLFGSRGLGSSNKKAAKKIDKYIDENIEKSNLHFVRGHSNIIFWSASEDEYDGIKKRISSELKNLGFRPYFATKEQLKNLYLNSFFANISCLDNTSMYLTELPVCCALFNNNGNYHNDNDGIYFNDRIYNLPVRYDFWDSGKKYVESRNFIIIAPTGSGKSFTANRIISQCLDQGVIHVIIDLGDSYIKLSQLYPEKDIEVFKYREGESLGLNPFTLNNDSLTVDKIRELCNFVWTLIKNDLEATELEYTSMRKLITCYYELSNNKDHSWESFYRFIELNRENILSLAQIEDKEYFDIGEFIHAGSEFVGNGLYANILRCKKDNAANFIGKKLIIFELDNIREDKRVLPIMLQVISEAINRTIWRDKENRGIVLFDEFAKQLEFPQIAKSVKLYAQAIRKQNGALGLILQTTNQLPRTPDGESILDNTQTFIILKSDDHKHTIERLSLNEHEASQIHSMRNQFSGEIKYSEIFLYRKKKSNVFRIEVSQETFLAFQTEGPIHTKIMKLYDEHGSMEKAIQEYQATHQT